MSEFCKPIEESFVCRTNDFIQKYNGRYDATILLNCLLGMLVVPFEKYNDFCRDDKRTEVIRDIFDVLQAEGRYNDYGNDYSNFQILRNLRNAIAHFNVKSCSEGNQITSLIFTTYQMDKYCDLIERDCPHKNIMPETMNIVFYAELKINELKELASYIKKYVLELEGKRKCQFCEYRSQQ
jgi:hypothetical protein